MKVVRVSVTDRQTHNLHYIKMMILVTVYKVKVKLMTVVGGDPKAAFSFATTLKCRRGCHSFPWIAPLCPCFIPYNAEY